MGYLIAALILHGLLAWLVAFFVRKDRDCYKRRAADRDLWFDITNQYSEKIDQLQAALANAEKHRDEYWELVVKARGELYGWEKQARERGQALNRCESLVDAIEQQIVKFRSESNER